MYKVFIWRYYFPFALCFLSVTIYRNIFLDSQIFAREHDLRAINCSRIVGVAIKHTNTMSRLNEWIFTRLDERKFHFRERQPKEPRSNEKITDVGAVGAMIRRASQEWTKRPEPRLVKTPERRSRDCDRSSIVEETYQKLARK